MRTVSRALILPILDAAAAKGVTTGGLFRGLAVDEPSVRAQERRLAWADYLTLYARLSARLGGPDALAALVGDTAAPPLRRLLAGLSAPHRALPLAASLVPVLCAGTELRVIDLPGGQLRIALAPPADGPDATAWLYAATPMLAALFPPVDGPSAGVHLEAVSPRGASWRVGAPPPLPSGPDPLAELLDEVSVSLRALLSDRAPIGAPDLDARMRQLGGAWHLTPAQALVLRGVVRGLSNKEIAAELGNAEATVEVHVTRLLRKAGATGRTALVTRFWAGGDE